MRHSITSIFTLCALLLPSALFAQGEHLVGQDQSVNRIIKLQSSVASKAVQDAASQVTSRVETPVRKAVPAFSNPPQIKFDEIRVPQTMTKPSTAFNSSNGFSQRPVQVVPPQVTPPRVAQTQQQWQYAKPPTKPKVTRQSSAKAINTSSGRLKQSGSSMIETILITPKSVNLNQQAQMQIELHNRGKHSIENVTLIATIPANAKLASATPTPTQNKGQTFEFSIPRIGASGSRSIVLNVVPTVKEALQVSTVVRVENSVESTVSVQQPELSLAISGPQEVNIGKKTIHELTVANIGDGVATDIRLDTLMPGQLKLVNQKGESFIRSLEPGKSVQLKYESLALAPGETELKVSAAATGCNPKTSSIKLNVYQPQLQVSAVGPKLNYVQRDGIYTIDIENTGVVDVTNTKISLQVPEGMKVTTISRQADVDASQGVLTWTFGKIQAKSSEKIQLKATAVEAGQQVCKMIVTSNETVQKEMLLTTQVVTRAELNVQIKNTSGPVQVGAKAQFLVTVENNGSQRANDVSIRVVLPDSLMAVKDDSIDQTNNTLSFSEPMVAAGDKVTFKFEAIGVVHGEHVVRSVLETEGSTRQVIAEDTVFVYQVDEARVSESTTAVVPR